MLRAHFAYCVDTERDSIQCFEGGWGEYVAGTSSDPIMKIIPWVTYFYFILWLVLFLLWFQYFSTSDLDGITCPKKNGNFLQSFPLKISRKRHLANDGETLENPRLRDILLKSPDHER